jgi:FKBP-type peptidyl-prolyl cis-trans isomerase
MGHLLKRGIFVHSRIALVCSLMIGLAIPSAGQTKKAATPAKKATDAPAAGGPTAVTGEPITSPSGLKYWDIKVGTGSKAFPGLNVTVHYTGWLESGKKFDSSLDRNQPFRFALGKGQVIPGWEEGISGMRVGGKRRLRIPSKLAYGTTGFGNLIPPGATLIFDIQLLGAN